MINSHGQQGRYGTRIYFVAGGFHAAPFPRGAAHEMAGVEARHYSVAANLLSARRDTEQTLLFLSQHQYINHRGS